MEKSYDYRILGEIGPPWTSMSQASMAKVMKAVLLTKSSILSTHVLQPEYAPRCSVVYSLKIPSEKVEEFEQISGYKLVFHPDIQIGMKTSKSVKKVIYESERSEADE